jgi:hypothetical protein
VDGHLSTFEGALKQLLLCEAVRETPQFDAVPHLGAEPGLSTARSVRGIIVMLPRRSACGRSHRLTEQDEHGLKIEDDAKPPDRDRDRDRTSAPPMVVNAATRGGRTMIRAHNHRAIQERGAGLCGQDDFHVVRCSKCAQHYLYEDEMGILYLNPGDLTPFDADANVPSNCRNCGAAPLKIEELADELIDEVAKGPWAWALPEDFLPEK